MRLPWLLAFSKAAPAPPIQPPTLSMEWLPVFSKAATSSPDTTLSRDWLLILNGAVAVGFEGTDFEAQFSQYLTATLGKSVYPLHVPQRKTLPAYTYQRLDSQFFPALSGSARLVRSRLRITAVSGMFDDVSAMADDLLAALQGYTGTMGDVEIRSIDVHETFDEDYQPSAGKSDSGTFRRSTELTVFYVQTQSLPCLTLE